MSETDYSLMKISLKSVYNRYKQLSPNHSQNILNGEIL